MKIFISHSGARSHAIAAALYDWLPRVIQAVEPFYSHEIEKGAKWMRELEAVLESTKFGIVCLTPDNLERRWIHYEAGALSKAPDAKIWTFLHGLKFLDVPMPLGDFQHTEAQDEADVLKMLQSINKRLADVGDRPLDNALLMDNFELHWPRLKAKLKDAENLSEPDSDVVERTEEDILLEVLEATRSQERVLTAIWKYLQTISGYVPAVGGMHSGKSSTTYNFVRELMAREKEKFFDPGEAEKDFQVEFFREAAGQKPDDPPKKEEG